MIQRYAKFWFFRKVSENTISTAFCVWFLNLPICLCSYKNSILKIRIRNPRNSRVIYLYSLRNACLQTFRNNRICLKLAYFLRKIWALRENNSRILTIKNVKLSGYYFYVNLNILEDFKICISVPLTDEISLPDRLYFLRYRSICALQLFVSQAVTLSTLKSF